MGKVNLSQKEISALIDVCGNQFEIDEFGSGLNQHEWFLLKRKFERGKR